VWSPPIVTILAVAWSNSRAPASICEIASSMSNGVHEMSPASTTCWVANGITSSPE
jgi:hypothetical protein